MLKLLSSLLLTLFLTSYNYQVAGKYSSSYQNPNWFIWSFYFYQRIRLLLWMQFKLGCLCRSS